MGRVAISGIVYALTKGGSGDRITLLPTSDTDYKSKVTRSTSGAARWLANVDDGALIELGAGGNQTRWIQFTLTAALSSPGTATATVDYDSEDEGTRWRNGHSDRNTFVCRRNRRQRRCVKER